MCFIPCRPPKSTRLRANCSLLLKRAPIRNTTKSPSISAVIRLPATSPTIGPPRVGFLPLILTDGRAWLAAVGDLCVVEPDALLVRAAPGEVATSRQ